MLKSYFSLGRDFVVRWRKRRSVKGEEKERERGKTEGKEERRKR